ASRAEGVSCWSRSRRWCGARAHDLVRGATPIPADRGGRGGAGRVQSQPLGAADDASPERPDDRRRLEEAAGRRVEGSTLVVAVGPEGGDGPGEGGEHARGRRVRGELEACEGAD